MSYSKIFVEYFPVSSLAITIVGLCVALYMTGKTERAAQVRIPVAHINQILKNSQSKTDSIIAAESSKFYSLAQVKAVQ